MDWLRDNLIHIYEEQMSSYINDPWKARDDYILVILNRSRDNVERFLLKHAARNLSKEEKIHALKLLEMQRHSMLMYTSCGWFFDDISGLETLQVMQFAARAMQLARDVSNLSLEETYITLLERASSNIPKYQNGGKIYKEFVRPAVLDLLRVGIHYAVSSLFEDYTNPKIIYSYTIDNQIYEQEEAGKQKLAIGKAIVRSDITWDENMVSFAILHLGDHNLVGGLREFVGEDMFKEMQTEIKEAFVKGDISKAIESIERYFDTGNCSLWHLFKDVQRKVLNQIIHETLSEVEVSLRQINEHHYSIIQVMRQLNVPLPRVLALIEEFIQNTDLLNLIESEDMDIQRLQKLIEKIEEGAFSVDKTTLNFLINNKINTMMREFFKNPYNFSLLESAESLLRTLDPLSLNPDLWESQNIYFSVGKQLLAEMEDRAGKGDKVANNWLICFENMGDYLQVKIV